MKNILKILPDDEHNKTLVSHVHPGDWVNPEASGTYNLVVIGAGTAGLVTAAGAAGLGAKVALVEKHLMGGDCLNTGCVPSKGLLSSSRVMADITRAGDFGITVPDGSRVKFKAVMERMRRLRAHIASHDSAVKFKNLGIDVYLGEGRFTGSNTLTVGKTHLKFRKAVVATGATPSLPSVEGLTEAGILTSETIFSLTELPENLVVIGGGPIGCELAQAFRRFGSQVTVIEAAGQFLGREDPDAAGIVLETFENEGIRLLLNSEITKVTVSGEMKMVNVNTNGNAEVIPADEILVSIGRIPNVDNLGLDIAGIEFDNRNGIHVNDHLQTTNPRIYAAGDVCMKHKFTHAADAAARIVIQNALFLGRKKLSRLIIPWCTYTDPEIAHVGLYEQDAEGKGIPVETYVRYFRDVDRAILDGDDKGFVKIHVKKGTGSILGATIVGKHAGDMINGITTAIAGKMKLGSLANVIHPYPTMAEAIKQTADAWNRTRLTPVLKKWFTGWFKLTRQFR